MGYTVVLLFYTRLENRTLLKIIIGKYNFNIRVNQI